MLAGFRVVPYYALTRFGHWDAMLNEAAPPAHNLFLSGIWHYARGLAYLGKGQLPQAKQELREVERISSDPALNFSLFSPNSAGQILAIAPHVLAGELAAAEQDYDNAIAHLEHAVRLDDGLVYTEPYEWHYPPRHALAAILLEAGRPAEAETVYWEDLRRNRENGWALYGLGRALQAQGDKDLALSIQQRFEQAFARADITLTASRLK